MCLIIDANVAHEFTTDPPHSDAVLVKKYVGLRKCGVALGGQLTRELFQTPIRRWLRELVRAGNAKVYDSVRVDELTTKLKKEKQCESNDEHILALALVSGARVAYTRDEKLHMDFTSAALINNPRGRIYSSAQHEHLIRSAGPCS